MHTYFIVTFIVYFSLLFLLAIAFRKKDASCSDILLGGRKLNFWVTALSAQASDMSSWLFMAFPMSIFVGGLSGIWIAVSLICGMFCSWQFVAPRLRTMTEEYNCYTLSSFFAKRYDDKMGLIRILSSIMMLLFITYYLSAGLISVGFLFESIFGADYLVGTLVAVCVMMGYTFIGGFVSVAWADLFQAVFLLGTIMAVPILSFTKIDGFQAISEAAQKAGISLNPFSTTSETPIRDIFFPLFGWGLGYFGMPHILIKFMGIKNPKDLVKSKFLGISWQILALGFAALVGIVSIPYFQDGILNAELVFVELVKDLFNPVFASIALCGIFAATISTMDSQILVCSSILTEDLYKNVFCKKLSAKGEIKAFRTSVVIISLIAFWISCGRNATIMDTVYFAWSGLGSSFGPLVLASLYLKSSTKEGAISGILVGGLVSALWPSFNAFLHATYGFAEIPSMIIAFPLSFFSIWMVSKFFKKPAVV